MKKTTAAVSLLLTASLVGTLALPAFAAEQSTPKDEIIYANLTASGERKDVTVVNSFVLDGDGSTKIVDFGDYSSVRNMTTTDELGISGGRITVDTAADRLSYEGTLPDAELPWSITVRYYLDGSELTAEQLAGRSGHLKIALTVGRNDSCRDGGFYDAYALQASITLDGDRCENIVSDGATVASVGSDKQLSYIILPGKGADISVEADVRDFEMDSIAINGVSLSISMSVDDDKLQNVIDELTDATSSLSDGSRDLEDGIGSLGSGVAQLGTGASQLRSGADELASGAGSLADGLGVISGSSGQLVDGAYAAFEGLCSASAASINAQLSANGLGEVTLTPENYADVLDGIIASLGADKVYEQARAAALAQVTAAVEAQAEELYAGYIAQNRDAIIDAYILSISDELYTDVARRAVAQQLAAAGMTEEQIAAYLQTVEGQAQIELVRSAISDEQKAQICASAAASLSDEQQTQILVAAQASLSDEQKKAAARRIYRAADGKRGGHRCDNTGGRVGKRSGGRCCSAARRS